MSMSNELLQAHVLGLEDQVKGEGGTECPGSCDGVKVTESAETMHDSSTPPTTSNIDWDLEERIAVAQALHDLLGARCCRVAQTDVFLADGRGVYLAELPNIKIKTGNGGARLLLPDFFNVEDRIEAAANHIKEWLDAPPRTIVIRPPTPMFSNPWVPCGMDGWVERRIGLKTQCDKKPVALVVGLMGTGKTRVAVEHPECLFDQNDGKISVLYQSLTDPAYKHDLEQQNGDAYALATRMLHNAAMTQVEGWVKTERGCILPKDVVLVVDNVGHCFPFVRGVVNGSREIYAHMMEFYGVNVGIALVGSGADLFFVGHERSTNHQAYRRFQMRH